MTKNRLTRCIWGWLIASALSPAALPRRAAPGRGCAGRSAPPCLRPALPPSPEARRRGMGQRLVSRFVYQARLRGAEGGDPASVIFDGIQSAAAKGVTLVLGDTAGRLQNK